MITEISWEEFRDHDKAYFDDIKHKVFIESRGFCHWRVKNIDWNEVENMEMPKLRAIEQKLFFMEGLTEDYYKLEEIVKNKMLAEMKEKKKKILKQAKDSAVIVRQITEDRVSKEMEEENPVDWGIQGEKNPVDWGIQGEKNVDYQIKWLGKEYRAIKKDCVGDDDKEHIYLCNPNYIDEIQEYDHIIVHSRGVFVIESKYYKGNLEIRPNGNWIRIDEKGQEKGISNPVQQVRRHHSLLESIFEENEIPRDCIVDIICISHSSAVITGEENSKVPVIKVDMLNDYIEDTVAQSGFEIDVENVISIINKYKVDK